MKQNLHLQLIVPRERSKLLALTRKQAIMAELSVRARPRSTCISFIFSLGRDIERGLTYVKGHFRYKKGGNTGLATFSAIGVSPTIGWVVTVTVTFTSSSTRVTVDSVSFFPAASVEVDAEVATSFWTMVVGLTCRYDWTIFFSFTSRCSGAVPAA